MGAKLIVVSNTQKSRLFELSNKPLIIIDRFRLTRIAIKTYFSVLISLIVFLVIILLAIASSSFEKIFVTLFQEAFGNQVNENLPVNSCFLGITSPCLVNGLLDPLPIIELKDIYVETRFN